MKLSDLITLVGDQNVKFQNLDSCATYLQAGMQGAKITFATSQPLTPDGTTDLGLVLWLPRDRVAEILRGSTAEVLKS